MTKNTYTGNQAYAKQKLALWCQGYQAALKGEARRKNYDTPWQEGFDKGLEVAQTIKEQGLLLTK